MEKSTQKQDMKLESGEKTAGQDFFIVLRRQFAAFAKQAGGVNRRGGDEAAPKDGYHERSV